MDERRQLPRWEVKKEARVWLPQVRGFCDCIIEDMHMKGMCVSFDKELPKEEPLRMSFAIEDNLDFIKIEAQVPWSREGQRRHVYGLSFNKISEEDKEKIFQFINDTCYDQFKKNWWAV